MALFFVKLQSLVREKRIIAAVVVVFFIPVWVWGIEPQVLRIPADFSYRADVTSVDNFFDEESGVFKGEQFSKTTFSYDVVSHTGDTLNIKNMFHVQTLDGKTIFKAEPIYGINALTGAHDPNAGDKHREGYLFAPRGIKSGQSFTYWHADSNVPAVMRFVNQEKLYGLTVYKYETDYGGPIDQTAALSFLPLVPEKRGVKLISKNNLWIEPVSGYLVKQEDYSTDYYYYDINTGERLAPYNKFINSFTEESVRTQAARASELKIKILFVTDGVPAVLIFISVLLLLSYTKHAKRVASFIGRNILVIVVVMISIVTTCVAYYYTLQQVQQKEVNTLEVQTGELTELIRNRLNIYLNSLAGGNALFTIMGNVSREQWKSYVGALNLDTSYPGIVGIGYAPVVDANSVDSFIEKMKVEFPDFKVFPPGNRDMYVPVTYIEPFNEKNKRSFGFDMYSQSDRQRGMIHARDEGGVAMSGKVQLIQEEGESKQNGFLAFAPLYKSGLTPPTVKQRRRDIAGFVYIPFFMDDFMKGVLGVQKFNLDIHIYDGLQRTSSSLLYDSDTSESSVPHGETTFKKNEIIYFAGHPWSLEYSNAEAYVGEASDQRAPLYVFLIGVVITILLFFLTRMLIGSRTRAETLAHVLTADLEKKQKELEVQNELLEKTLVETEKTNKLMIGRELKMVELKKEIEVLKKTRDNTPL